MPTLTRIQTLLFPALLTLCWPTIGSSQDPPRFEVGAVRTLARSDSTIRDVLQRWVVGERINTAALDSTRDELANAERRLAARPGPDLPSRAAIAHTMRVIRQQRATIDTIEKAPTLSKSQVQAITRRQTDLQRELRPQAQRQRVPLSRIDPTEEIRDDPPSRVYPRPGVPTRQGLIRREFLPEPFRNVPAAVSDWVQTDGEWVYYRYGAYLDADCCERIKAYGNWPGYGWERERGLPVEKLDDQWLRVNMLRILERPYRARKNATYCVNFWDGRRQDEGWGQHGSHGAPGLDENDDPSIVVFSDKGDRNIGFAIVDSSTGPRVQLTNRYPGARC